jgi:molybdopterin converting factor small subunit
VKVRVVAFARVRELLGPSRDVELPPGSTAGALWDDLEKTCDDLPQLARSTRIARNGRVVRREEPLQDGDEIALLPPAGGG